MGLISPGEQNLQDSLELGQVLSTYDGDLRDLLWWPQERREELEGRATIPRVPQMSQSFPGKPVFPALPRLSSTGSTHTTVACGTALWEILVGKPRGKASWESLVGKPRGKATDPLIHAKGSGTLLIQLRRNSHVHAPTRDKD